MYSKKLMDDLKAGNVRNLGLYPFRGKLVPVVERDDTNLYPGDTDGEIPNAYGIGRPEYLALHAVTIDEYPYTRIWIRKECFSVEGGR